MPLLRIDNGKTEDVNHRQLSETISCLIKEDPCYEFLFEENGNTIVLFLKSGKKIEINCRSATAPRWFDSYFSLKVNIKD